MDIHSVDPIDVTLASELASQGLSINENLYTRFSPFYTVWGDKYPPFMVAVACSLVWSKHALNDPDFFAAALEYLAKGDPHVLGTASGFYGKNGLSALSEALEEYRILFTHCPPPDGYVSDAAGLRDFQDVVLNTAQELTYAGDIKGIGGWLFFGPFKVQSVYRKDLWQDPLLDDIILPLGVHLRRGIQRLRERGCTIVPEFIRESTGDTIPGLVDSLAETGLSHTLCRDLARLSGSRVLHIHSGLHDYAKTLTP